MSQVKRYAKVGERIRTVGSYSEMMCHCGYAGRPVDIVLTQSGPYFGGRAYKVGEGGYVSGTPGEVGFYQDAEGYYCYPEDGPGDENPQAVIAEATAMLNDAIDASGVQVTTISNLGII